MAVVVVFSTFPPGERAAEVARTLVSENLVACVNLVPQVRSIYRWQGQLQDDTEMLAIMKSTRDRVGELTSRLAALHPYEVPEIIVLPVDGGHAPYLAWVAGETTSPND